jgi:hypothetical protein
MALATGTRVAVGPITTPAARSMTVDSSITTPAEVRVPAWGSAKSNVPSVNGVDDGSSVGAAATAAAPFT